MKIQMTKKVGVGLSVLVLGALLGAPASAAELNVVAEAAYTGNFGLQVNMNTSTVAYVQDNSPAAEGRYRVRFYANVSPATITGEFDNFRALDGSDNPVVRVTFATDGVRFRTVDGGGTATAGPFPIQYGWHAFEFDWQVSSAPGANDGVLDVWIDGVQLTGLTGLDSDGTSVETARWGYLSGTAPTGNFELDDFVSTRDTYIGLADSGPPVAGDWDGDGVAEILVNRDGVWDIYLP